MKKTLVLLFLLLGLTIRGDSLKPYSKASVSINGQLKVKGIHLVDQNDEIVQLRGMSSFWLNWNGEFANYDAIKWLKEDWNISVFRAAMGIEMPGGYVDYPEYNMDIMSEIIDACIELDLYVIVDWHSHYASSYIKESKDFFDKISKKYGEVPNIIYEIWNEPMGQTEDEKAISWDDDIKPYSEEIISVIRKNDPDGIILVGTPSWSQDVDIAAKNPINESNIMYSLHFYSGTHKEELRKKAEKALKLNIPIFVDEFGVSKASGNEGVHLDEADLWMEWLEKNKISWVNWSLCDKDESASALVPGASIYGGWGTDSLTESGKYIKSKISSIKN